MRSRKLESILRHNVALIHFIKKTNRRERLMLCTKSPVVLQEPMIGYRPPRSVRNYNPNSYENVLLWDIEKRDYRQAWSRTTTIVDIIPADEFLDNLKKYKGQYINFLLNE